MKKLWLIFAQACTLGLGLALALQAVNTLHPRPATGQSPPERSLVQAAAQVAPAVVAIRTDDEPGGAASPTGSGVIVHADGWIVTNHHVVAEASQVRVQLPDGREGTAQVTGSDPETDLAVLRTDLRALPVARWGSSQQLVVGEPLLAIGNPFGVGQTVTAGIVSALQRKALGINVFENFIQTDAAINPGNSGGALVNSQGLVVGIPSAIYSRDGGSIGLGFAIPAELAQQVVQALQTQGYVQRGWLGVQTRAFTPDLARVLKLPAHGGVLVSVVIPDSPAAQIQLHTGDVIESVGGTSIRSPEHLLDVVAELRPGQRAPITLRRNGQALTVEVAVGQRPRPGTTPPPVQD
ncbi:trypsin-like peptidase domain-containing protein [Inhella sp. 4Y17]|uniref:Trypsin-like peptidase domain-containing protein n=1 Tax=Inhella gelatinilytica TaxID=2795030 RepID=A0A931NDN5_9BURK|nr:trypsin-like peptidase domain-containing protein [Inhella gelatinilytica]